MPLEAELYAAFLLSALVISIVPGPDMVFVVASGLRLGPRGGLAAAVGIAGGMLVHTAAAIAGLSALVYSSAAVFEAVRWLGVAYLLWLAVGALRSPGGPQAMEATGETSLLRVGRQGAITNFLNPKVIVFFLAFLPQFVDPAAGGVGVQLLGLGLGFAAVGLVVDGSVGIASGSLGRRLGAPRRVRRWLDRIAAAVFVGLAVRLVVDR